MTKLKTKKATNKPAGRWPEIAHPLLLSAADPVAAVPLSDTVTVKVASACWTDG